MAANSPLRIAVVAPQFPKLSETFILDHVTGLIDRGHEVVVVANRSSVEEPFHPDVGEYGLLDQTHYAPDLSSMSRPWRHLRIAVTLVESLVRMPRPTMRALRGKVRSQAKGGTLVRRFSHLARAGDQDIFHCHYGPTGAWVSEVLPELGFRGRLVTTFHGYDVSKYVHKHGEAVYRELFKHGDLLLPVSDYWRNRLLELGAPADRTQTHRMGIDLGRYRFMERPPTAELRVLSISRLVAKKGLEYGIQAVALLARQGLPIRYTVAGDGPERGRLEALTSELGLDDSVRFVGRVPRQAVLDLMASHDVLIAPSVTSAEGDQEGIPIVVMEAMSTGMPVVASRHSGIPELVRDGDTGLLSDERSIDQLAAQLHRLAIDEELRHRLGKQGRAAVMRDHDSSVLTDRLVERYRDLLAMPSKPPG